MAEPYRNPRLGATFVSIPSQAGILLADGNHGWRRRLKSLNTLTGGHPLGGPDCRRGVNMDTESLNTLTGGHPLGGADSIWRASQMLSACLNTLTGGHPLGGADVLWCWGCQCLNTLTGGHPLGGRRWCWLYPTYRCLNTLTGGHPLGGRVVEIETCHGELSQYPHRRASSWRLLL